MKPLMAAAAGEATDDQLVAATREGSEVAFEALFRRYKERITAYVRGIVADHARAEDIVQDAFMSALRSMRSSDREVVFRPWIYEIAKNACIDHLRRSGRAHEVSIDSEDFSPVDEGRMSAGVASTDAAFATREDLDTLKMAFNDLPDTQHEILVMRELEGLSYDRIGTELGLSRGAVESMLFRARRSLKDGFDDIATGERCERMRGAMGHAAMGNIGLRESRRLTGHLRDCASCRREAVAMGLDELALRSARGRARTALSRVAAFLPLPGFLRRRLTGGAQALAQGGGAAEQGMSLAGKAAALVAAVAVVGGGAGVAHKVAASSHSPGGALELKHGPNGSPAGSPAAGTRGGEAGAKQGSGDAHGGGAAGGGAASGAQGGSGAGRILDPKLGAAGGLAGGKTGALPGSGQLDTTVQGVTNGTGDTVQKLGTTVGGTIDGAIGGRTGSTVGQTIDGTTQTLGQTIKSVPVPKLGSGTSGGGTSSLLPSTPDLSKTTSTLPTVTIPTATKKLGL